MDELLREIAAEKEQISQTLTALEEALNRWHKDLLDLAVDQHIITLDLSRTLDEYRAFRHFFVHGYGVMLDEARLSPLAEHLPKVWEQFEEELAAFVASIET